MQQEFAKRRKQFFKCLDTNSIAVLFNASLAIRNGDGEYSFRPASDFYYLTGFEEPDAIAVFIKDQTNNTYLLFHLPRDPKQEQWVGRRFDDEEVCQLFGADKAYSLDLFESKLLALLSEKSRIFYAFGNAASANKVDALCKKLPVSRLKSTLPKQFENISPFIHELRLRKSDYEIAQMRFAAQVSVKGHQRAMRVCAPGLFEYQIEGELVHAFYQEGARFTAYPSIVAGGPRACIMHYHANTAALKDGDLLLVDAGAEYQFYASDITRTFPVNGKFTERQREIYDIVLAAQLAGIAEVKPKNPYGKVQDAIVSVITEGLMQLGILKGNLESLIEQKAYQRFYIHNSGHWLGLDTHDVGDYQIDSQWRLFEPSMVLTVEPGIYISEGDETVDPAWRGIGIRIEDDVLVTAGGNEVLSEGLVKAPEAVEAYMKS